MSELLEVMSLHRDMMQLTRDMMVQSRLDLKERIAKTKECIAQSRRALAEFRGGREVIPPQTAWTSPSTVNPSLLLMSDKKIVDLLKDKLRERLKQVKQIPKIHKD